MEEIIKGLEGVYFSLIHQENGQWYVMARTAILKKNRIELNSKEDYEFNPPVFNSDTIEGCLGELLKYLNK